MAIYLDNAATSWPKPPTVIKAMSDYLEHYGGSPGRSGHAFALKAAREVFETRELIAGLFNVPDSDKVIFTANGTHAINLGLKGLLKKGDHVIISHLEHNSVFRPLKHMEKAGLIELSIVDAHQNGSFIPQDIVKAIKSNTRLIAMLHGSNVSGTLLPVGEIGAICKQFGILYLVDAAQTAGLISVDMQQDNIDLLAFSGHKELYGPPGIGCLCVKKNLPLTTLMQGGTGSMSEMAAHPDFYPDRLEAGTLNTVGIIGLKAGIEFILQEGFENIYQAQIQLIDYVINELKEIDQVQIIASENSGQRLPVVSLIIKGVPSSDVALRLDQEFGIMARAGLHCSPLAHKALGTFPHGTVRLSPGIFTTQKEIDYTIQSLKKICQTKSKT